MTAESRPARCSSGACIDVRITDTAVEIRDTKQSISPVLTLGLEEWHHNVLANLLITRNGLPASVARIDNNTYAWCGTTGAGHHTALWFNADEWWTFVDAVRNGQHRVPAVTR